MSQQQSQDDGLERVTLRMPSQQVNWLEADVEAGKFPNRSEAIRYIVASYYDQPEFSRDVEVVESRKGAPKGGWPTDESDNANEEFDPAADVERVRKLRRNGEAADDAPEVSPDPDDDASDASDVDEPQLPETGQVSTEEPSIDGDGAAISALEGDDPESEVDERTEPEPVVDDPDDDTDADELLDHTDPEDLQHAYDEADGNVSAASERFEIGYNAVRERMIDAGVYERRSYGEDSQTDDEDDPEYDLDPNELEQAYEDTGGVITDVADQFEAPYKVVYRHLVDHLIHEPGPRAPREKSWWCGTCHDGPMSRVGVKRHHSQKHDGDLVILDHEPVAEEEEEPDAVQDDDSDDDVDDEGSPYTIDNPEGYLTTLKLDENAALKTAHGDVCEILGVDGDETVAYWSQDGSIHLVGPDGPIPDEDAVDDLRFCDTRSEYNRAAFNIQRGPLKAIGGTPDGDVKLFDRGDRVLIRAVDDDGELLGEDVESVEPDVDDGPDDPSSETPEPVPFVDYANQDHDDVTLSGIPVDVPDGVTADSLQDAVRSGDCRTIGDVCDWIGLELDGNGTGRGAVRSALHRLGLYEELDDPEGDTHEVVHRA